MDPRIKSQLRRVETKDLDELQMWFKMWGLRPPPKDRFSDLGYIVPATAAGFLYLTNSGVGILDAYIARPGASKYDRDHALDAITYALERDAKTAGVTFLKGDTNYRTIMRRAERFGFKSIGQAVGFAKEL